MYFIKKNFKYILFILILLMALVLPVYEFQIKNKDYLEVNCFSNENNVKKIEDSNEIVIQEFISTNNNLGMIKIDTEIINIDYTKQKLEIKLKNEKGKIITKKEITVTDLKAKNSYMLNIPVDKKSKNKKYILELKSKDYGKAFYLKYDNESNIKGSSFKIDNDQKDGNLSFSVYYKNNNLKYFVIIEIALFIIGIISIFIIMRKNLKIEKIYLLSSILIYMLYICFIPTLTNHDELYHWFRAYEVSEGNLLSEINDNKALSSLPTSVGAIMNTEFFKQTYHSTKDSLEIRETKEETFYDMKTVSIYSPLQYIPQALGIRFASIFTDRTMLLAYFGRIFNALFSIFMIYFSIKIIPFGKKILFVLSFIPIAIEGFTSLSPDAITLSSSLLLISYVLNLTYNKKFKEITKKDYVILLLLSTILSLCKIVYVPMVFLTLLIPMKKFKKKRNYLLFNISIILISLLMNFIWLAIASKYLALYDSSGGQVLNVLMNPFNYFMILIYTICSNFQNYLLTAFGNEILWVNMVKFATIIPYCFIVLILMAALFDKEINKNLNLKSNLFYGIIFVCIVGLIFTSLYVQWTPIGSDTIEGVQGRYFLPILPLILFLISNLKIEYKGKCNLDKILYLSSIILNIYCLGTIFIKFI